MSKSNQTAQPNAKLTLISFQVFSKSYCPFGGRVETLLKNQRLPYGLLYLDNMDEGDAIQSALFEKTGQKTVPNVFVSGQHIGE